MSSPFSSASHKTDTDSLSRPACREHKSEESSVGSMSILLWTKYTVVALALASLSRDPSATRNCVTSAMCTPTCARKKRK